VTLPIAVDQSDDSKIAIDWDRAPGAPAEGQVRPAGRTTPPQQYAQHPAGGWDNVASQDSVAKLEKLAQLKESGALTEAEFEAQKVKILSE
jgi:hypothetical protein